jgi:taurine dioxygenase
MNYRYRSLSERLGTEAEGVDLSRGLPAASFEELEAAFYRSGLLVLRGQRLDAPGFHAFASRIGVPEPHVIDQFHHPEIADILILSNVRRDGQPTGLADGGTYFHTDYSYLEKPARATLLYSITVPSRGGDTLFADQRAAWDDLPAARQRELEGLVARHHYGNRDDLDKNSRTVASVLSDEQEGRLDWVRHPLVRTHPVTGRKALYAVSGSSFGIDGMADADGRALLDELKRHATHERYRVSVRYGVGDVVVWDNLSLLHSATLIDPDDPRTLWRITVKAPSGIPA